MVDRRYVGRNRIDLKKEIVPPYSYVSGDKLKPVKTYVVIRGRTLPDGVYTYDGAAQSAMPDVVGQLVRIGGKDEMKKLVAAFPDKDFAEEAPLLYGPFRTFRLAL